jgi:hypothetical protein
MAEEAEPFTRPLERYRDYLRVLAGASASTQRRELFRGRWSGERRGVSPPV